MRRQVIALSSIALLVAPVLMAQDAPVQGARISLLPVTVAIERVTIENRRNSPLVAWRIGLFSSGAAEPATTHASDLAGMEDRLSTASGPIGPNARRVIEIQLVNRQDLSDVALTLVAFADGYYEGTRSALGPWRQQRQDRADDLEYWIRAVDAMPRDSADAVRRHLAERAGERAGQIKDDPSGLRDRMSVLSRQSSRLSELLPAIDRSRASAARELAALAPSLSGDLAIATRDRVTAATTSSHRAVATDLMAGIENVRSVPIEAYAFEILDPGLRVTAGQSIDLCATPVDSERGHGRIVPGEMREVSLGVTLKDGEAPPSLRLKYVMFQDLSFEGSAADREILLRNRERHAADLAYTLAALEEAVARPDDAEVILTVRRSERATLLQGQGRSGNLLNLDELLRQVKAGPQEFLANVPALRQSLESERQLLLRHLRR